MPVPISADLYIRSKIFEGLLKRCGWKPLNSNLYFTFIATSPLRKELDYKLRGFHPNPVYFIASAFTYKDIISYVNYNRFIVILDVYASAIYKLPIGFLSRLLVTNAQITISLIINYTAFLHFRTIKRYI